MGRRGRANLIEEQFYFVTTTVVDWINVFTEDRYCDILVRNIKHYQKRYGFNVLGYVIMPSHFHWIVEVDPKKGTISDIMRDIKKYSAWDLLEELENDGRGDLISTFTDSARGFPNHKHKLWISRFDDEVIRNQPMFWAKLTYIHSNPVEAGMVERPEDYRYSSAHNYIVGDHSVLYVDTTKASPTAPSRNGS
jgi:REP-associated tyrosine transposase